LNTEQRLKLLHVQHGNAQIRIVFERNLHELLKTWIRKEVTPAEIARRKRRGTRGGRLITIRSALRVGCRHGSIRPLVARRE
jgi:hypothetical protein